MSEEYPWLPSLPNEENETSISTIPENVNEVEIENALESITGKVNVVSGHVYLDMPEGWSKACLSLIWGHYYFKWGDDVDIWFAGGTCGTKYQNNSLLSPDLSAWKIVERPFNTETFNFEHMWSDFPAPNWVLEFEWRNELLKEKKGMDKINNYFFNETYVGINGTTVDEAWLLVKAQDAPIRPYRPLSTVFRFLRWIASLFTWFLWILKALDVLIPMFNWSGIIRAKHQPPANIDIPYIVVCFRGDIEPYGYYWLEWNTNFIPPNISIFAHAPIMDVNMLLKKLSGKKLNM
jgi:hypothetical protein